MLRLGNRFREAFEREYRVDGDVRRAALAVGVGSNLAHRWVRQSGGMIRIKAADTGYRLSFEERERIEELLRVGSSQAAIARDLGRSRSTICRELQRNARSYATPHGGRRVRPYVARIAQVRTEAVGGVNPWWGISLTTCSGAVSKSTNSYDV